LKQAEGFDMPPAAPIDKLGQGVVQFRSGHQALPVPATHGHLRSATEPALRVGTVFVSDIDEHHGKILYLEN